MKPPDSLSWRFWKKPPGCQKCGLEASWAPRAGAARGNERHSRGLKNQKPLWHPETSFPPLPRRMLPQPPPDVGSQGGGWGGAAGGGGGIAAGFERELPEQMGLPYISRVAAVNLLPAASPSPLPAARGWQGPVGTRPEGHRALGATGCPQPLAGPPGSQHLPLSQTFPVPWVQPKARPWGAHGVLVSPPVPPPPTNPWPQLGTEELCCCALLLSISSASSSSSFSVP